MNPGLHNRGRPTGPDRPTAQGTDQPLLPCSESAYGAQCGQYDTKSTTTAASGGHHVERPSVSPPSDVDIAAGSVMWVGTGGARMSLGLPIGLDRPQSIANAAHVHDVLRIPRIGLHLGAQAVDIPLDDLACLMVAVGRIVSHNASQLLG